MDDSPWNWKRRPDGNRRRREQTNRLDNQFVPRKWARNHRGRFGDSLQKTPPICRSEKQSAGCVPDLFIAQAGIRRKFGGFGEVERQTPSQP